MSTKHLACDPCQQPDAPTTPGAPIGDAPRSGVGALPANGRTFRQPLPAAAERLRRMFPDVWARYQETLAASGRAETSH
jgi:hypothetical protein